MSRQSVIKDIVDSFDSSVNDFKEQSKGIFCDIYSEYKGNESVENIKFHYAKVYYNSYILLFKYTPHGVLSSVNSILECLVFLDKNEKEIAFPMSYVFNFLEIDTLRPLIVPYISNSKAMKETFELISNNILCYQDKLQKLSYDSDKKIELYNKFIYEIASFYKKDKMNYKDFVFYKSMYYNWLTNRSGTPYYSDFLTGKYKSAIKKLNKLKYKSEYEKHIILLMMNVKEPPIYISSIIINNLNKYNSFGMPKSNFKEFIAFFVSGLFWTLIYVPVFIGIFFLFYSIENIRAVYLMGPINKVDNALLVSFLLGTASSYFTRLKTYQLFFKRDYKEYIEMDYMENIKFKNNGFIDNTKFLSFQGQYYSYSDVKKVYYKPNRLNKFGEKLDSPSYVLELKSGKKIDFYEYDNINKVEEKVLPLLSEKKIEIEQ